MRGEETEVVGERGRESAGGREEEGMRSDVGGGEASRAGERGVLEERAS